MEIKKTNGNNREFSMQCNMNTDQVQIEPLHILLYALIEQHCYNRNSHCGKLFFPAFTYLSECTKHRLGLFEQNLSNCATQMLLPSSTWATNLQFVKKSGLCNAYKIALNYSYICIALRCIALNCTALHYIALHCIALQCLQSIEDCMSDSCSLLTALSPFTFRSLGISRPSWIG